MKHKIESKELQGKQFDFLLETQDLILCSNFRQSAFFKFSTTQVKVVNGRWANVFKEDNREQKKLLLARTHPEISSKSDILCRLGEWPVLQHATLYQLFTAVSGEMMTLKLIGYS